jgi:hypothetical protein
MNQQGLLHAALDLIVRSATVGDVKLVNDRTDALLWGAAGSVTSATTSARFAGSGSQPAQAIPISAGTNM